MPKLAGFSESLTPLVWWVEKKKVETIQDINCFHSSKCWFPHLSFPKRGKQQGTQLPSELNSMGTAQEDCKRPMSGLELEPSHFTEWTRPKERMISFVWHFQRLVKQGPTQGTLTLTKLHFTSLVLYPPSAPQPCLTLCNPMDCSPPGSSAHGDPPGKNTATWVAMSSSRGSSQPRDRTQLSHFAGGFFTIWATR